MAQFLLEREQIGKVQTFFLRSANIVSLFLQLHETCPQMKEAKREIPLSQARYNELYGREIGGEDETRLQIRDIREELKELMPIRFKPVQPQFDGAIQSIMEKWGQFGKLFEAPVDEQGSTRPLIYALCRELQQFRGKHLLGADRIRLIQSFSSLLNPFLVYSKGLLDTFLQAYKDVGYFNSLHPHDAETFLKYYEHKLTPEEKKELVLLVQDKLRHLCNFVIGHQQIQSEEYLCMQFKWKAIASLLHAYTQSQHQIKLQLFDLLCMHDDLELNAETVQSDPVEEATLREDHACLLMNIRHNEQIARTYLKEQPAPSSEVWKQHGQYWKCKWEARRRLKASRVGCAQKAINTAKYQYYMGSVS